MTGHDGFNQLVKTVTGNKVSTYKYNGEGLRVEKTTDGATTRYLYEYDRIVLETDGSGAQTARNIYGMNLVSRKTGTQTLYYLYNVHADVTALIDSAGNIVVSYYYNPFGNILESTGTVNNPIRYAGYQYDEESGYYYLNARMYDPRIARFLQVDTYKGDVRDPLSLNLYTYCHNEPIMYWDPTGNTVWRLRTLVENSKEGLNYVSNSKFNGQYMRFRVAVDLDK